MRLIGIRNCVAVRHNVAVKLPSGAQQAILGCGWVVNRKCCAYEAMPQAAREGNPSWLHLHCARKARGDAVYGIVGAHDLLHVSLLHAGAEGREVRVVQVELMGEHQSIDEGWAKQHGTDNVPGSKGTQSCRTGETLALKSCLV